VTIGIIVVNVLVFIYELSSPHGVKGFVMHAAVPKVLSSPPYIWSSAAAVSLIASIFGHGDVFHLGGNMLFLWVFGNNVEARLGAVRFCFFYLLAGLVAIYTYVVIEPTITSPIIGASGAISGVLGAYLILSSQARIRVLVFLIFFIKVFRWPAYVVIVLWALIQFIYAALSYGDPVNGGIAWFSHLGGFVFGVVSIKLWLLSKQIMEKKLTASP
jgi:membrane associated rhomboid family serine protease